MNAPIAITGQLVDIRNVATHKVARMVIDVPAEQAAGIVSMFGWPTMANPVPVAIARLNPEAAAPATSGREREAPSETTPPAPLQPSDKPEKRKWHELPLSQQASMRCREQQFRKFLQEFFKIACNNETDAAIRVRAYCGVVSRKDIHKHPDAASAWNYLETQFQIWLEAPKVGVPA